MVPYTPSFTAYLYLHEAYWLDLHNVAPEVLDDPESRDYYGLTHTAEGAD